MNRRAVLIAVPLAVAAVLLGGCGQGGRNGAPAPVTTGAVPSAPSAPADPHPAPFPVGVPAGTPLQPAGSFTVTRNGAVVQDLHVTGTITVQARDVQIKRTLFTGDGSANYAVQLGADASARITDSTIRGAFGSAGISAGDWQAQRLDIYDASHDGAKLGTGSSISDSWIHDFDPEPGAHSDGLQSDRLAGDITIAHNVIDIGAGRAEDNSAIILTPGTGGTATGSVAITGNVLGGGGYTLYYDTGYADVRVTGNTFRANAKYGPIYPAPQPPVFTGNTLSTGGPLVWPAR